MYVCVYVCICGLQSQILNLTKLQLKILSSFNRYCNLTISIKNELQPRTLYQNDQKVQFYNFIHIHTSIVRGDKRGDKNNPQNYRGITLTSTMSKIFTYLLNRRHWCDDNKILSEAQFAYKPGYGTVDVVFVLKCMFDSHRSGVHYAFIDYSKAFDLIDRNLLYNKLLNFGISNKFLKIIMNMYSKLSSKVRTASRMSDPFNLECGVMQGECLSPSFFALHINEIASKMNEIPSMGLMFGDRKISVLKYADDLVLCAKTSVGLQAGLNALYEFCTTNSLTVNTEKSKVMYVSSKKSKKLPILSYNHEALQFVDSFKYLDINISRTGKLTEGLTNVCQQADRAQTVLDLHILKHPSVSVNHIFELFDCLLKPILMYVWAIWSPLLWLYRIILFEVYETYLRCKSEHKLHNDICRNKAISFSVHINKCMLKFWFKILNSDHEKLIYILYHHLLTSNVKCELLTHIKKILCTNGFPYVWENQGVLNEKQFLCLFEQRSKDIFFQECLSEISLSLRCRMYKEIKPTFGCELYLEMNINTRLRSCLTKLRLSSHEYLVERGRWLKPKLPYIDRKCTLCNIPDIQDEYHVTLCCVYFKELRRKYIKPYYYKRPSMNKFVELMKTRNKREIHRIMLFAKFALKKYLDTLLE